MTGNTLGHIRNFILLTIVQVLIFSQIHLFGYATACVFLIFILKLPRHTKTTELLIWGFLFGMAIDMFCNTPGINAAAATSMSFVRNPILAAFTHKGMPEDFIPGVKTIKWGGYITYSLLCILTFYAVLFLLEIFTINYPGTIIISALSSTLLTMLFVSVMELFSRK